MNTSVVHINAGNGYDVVIGRKLLDECGEYLADVLSSRNAAIITDSNVMPLYLERVMNSLKRSGFSVCSFCFDAGEPSKNMVTLSQILEFLAENHMTRKDCVIALGGGVTGDMAGFAAGCYMRGIRFVQIPTTLLAAVDSSVGGKTAVDLTAGKNLAGLFIQPDIVLMDLDTLKSLTPHFLADGMAEAIKTAILSSGEMLSLFEEGKTADNLQEIITGCVRYKGYVVEEDEFESGMRQLLNLGHTVGHAVEKCSGYSITHGHAVAIGTAIICRAAAKNGFCDIQLAKRVESILSGCGLPTETAYDAGQLAQAALVDKKRKGDSITLVLPRTVGDCVLYDMHISQLEGFIAAGLERM